MTLHTLVLGLCWLAPTAALAEPLFLASDGTLATSLRVNGDEVMVHLALHGDTLVLPGGVASEHGVRDGRRVRLSLGSQERKVRAKVDWLATQPTVPLSLLGPVLVSVSKGEIQPAQGPGWVGTQTLVDDASLASADTWVDGQVVQARPAEDKRLRPLVLVGVAALEEELSAVSASGREGPLPYSSSRAWRLAQDLLALGDVDGAKRWRDEAQRWGPMDEAKHSAQWLWLSALVDGRQDELVRAGQAWRQFRNKTPAARADARSTSAKAALPSPELAHLAGAREGTALAWLVNAQALADAGEPSNASMALIQASRFDPEDPRILLTRLVLTQEQAYRKQLAQRLRRTPGPDVVLVAMVLERFGLAGELSGLSDGVSDDQATWLWHTYPSLLTPDRVHFGSGATSAFVRGDHEQLGQLWPCWAWLLDQQPQQSGNQSEPSMTSGVQGADDRQ